MPDLDARRREARERAAALAVDRDPESYCHRCGGPNISWFTPGAVWDPVMRPTPGAPWKWNEIICPPCFVELAGGGSWTLIPMKDDGEPWTSADERARIVADAERRGRAEVSAAVEAVCAELTAEDDVTEWGEHGKSNAARRVRAILTDPAAAVARIKAAALREAAEDFATGAWADAFAADEVEDDVSAVRSTERWLLARADRVGGAR